MYLPTANTNTLPTTYSGQQFPNMSQMPPYMPYQIASATKRTSESKDPQSPTIEAVLQQITKELKAILKKDFNKKMVENTAFKKFESWWEEESSKENKSKNNKEETATIQNRDNINVLLETNRENLYNNVNLDNVGFGLGLKASLPKMPSFRRKKIPSPVHAEDDDSRKLSDDNDEIVHSDSELREQQRPLRRIRKRSSTSSSSTSSSESSSSESSSSSDESSSDSESVAPPVVQKKEKTPPPPVVERSIERVEVEMKPAPADRYSKIYPSDSDLSDGELEYLERRRRNTEWMEQIEKERRIREKQEPAKIEKELTPVKSESEDTEMDDLEAKSLEKLESEREKLLEQVRNPEPPNDLSEIQTESSDEENLEERRRKKVKLSPKRVANKESKAPSVVSEVKSESPKSQVVMEHSYCMQPMATEAKQENLVHDHGYTVKEQREAPPDVAPVKTSPVVYTAPPVNKETKPKPPRPRKRKEHKKLQELQNINYGNNDYVARQYEHVKHKERDVISQMGILYEFLTKGIDHEDIQYMRRSYEFMLADDSMGYWLNDTHWVDHCVTDLYSSPPKRRKRDDVRVHATGCARTEGFYKIEALEKAKYKYHHAKSNAIVASNGPVNKMQGEFSSWSDCILVENDTLTVVPLF